MAVLETWPFWAPSEADAVEAALDLAGVGPGDRFVDLGCGDGQVVLAAARRGALASGIEADPDLVDEARSHLTAAGVEADLRVGDLLDPALPLDADVYFTYLAPATLQRLHPRLAGQRGARLVTVDFAVPGLTPTRRSGPARLYLLPGRRRRPAAVGWSTAGTLVAAVPDHHSLGCFDLVHPGGDSGALLTGSIAAAASIVSGADHLDGPAELAVDLRWEPMALDTIASGAIAIDGVDDHEMFVIWTDDDEGMWELTPQSVEAIRRGLRRRNPPTTLADLLDLTVV